MPESNPKPFLLKHWFLLALGVCFVGGYALSGAVQPIVQSQVFRGSLVFAVMWMMGVTLKPGAVRRSISRPGPSLLAIAINVVVVPVACLPLWWILDAASFGGLFVAALVPGTLASASVWTRKAGGDDSIAMMNTVVTNLACVVVVPIGLALVLARQASLSPVDQMVKLAVLVVLPMVLAQLMRIKLAPWADRNKPRISLLAQIGILIMVFIGAAASVTYLMGAGDWLLQIPMLLLTAIIHSLVLWLGILLAKGMKMKPEQQIAVGISGSQKTLMVGLQVAISTGVSVLPMLMYHLSQLIIDTIVASHWQACHGGASGENAIDENVIDDTDEKDKS